MSGAFTKTYDSTKSQNQNYWVRIGCGAMGVEIIAEMPEEITSAVGSEWEALLPASLGSVPLVGDALNFAAQSIGGSGVVLQGATQQIWVNSSPMELPLTLQFDIENDAREDVYAPMRLLEMMAMPNEAGGFLYSPGTNLGALAGGDSSISLAVGQYLKIPRIIITSVQSQFSSRLDARGYPISGRSDITFRTDRVLSREDWRKMTSM